MLLANQICQKGPRLVTCTWDLRMWKASTSRLQWVLDQHVLQKSSLNSFSNNNNKWKARKNTSLEYKVKCKILYYDRYRDYVPMTFTAMCCFNCPTVAMLWLNCLCNVLIRPYSGYVSTFGNSTGYLVLGNIDRLTQCLWSYFLQLVDLEMLFWSGQN